MKDINEMEYTYFPKLAGVILAYNRPNYLKQTIKSIESNELSKEIDWYFYLDGGDIKTKKCEQIFNNSSLNGTLYKRDKNYGIAWQKYYSHSHFNDYDAVIFFEDDMIVSPYYLNILISLHKQFPDCVVYAPDGKLKINNFSEKNLKKVNYSNAHFWGYLMPSNIGLKITPIFYDYCKDCGPNYMNRPSKKLIKKYGLKIASHDAMLGKALKNEEVKRLSPLIPRARYIGAVGMNFSSDSFKRKGFHKTKQYIFESDKNRTEWELV